MRAFNKLECDLDAGYSQRNFAHHRSNRRDSEAGLRGGVAPASNFELDIATVTIATFFDVIPSQGSSTLLSFDAT